MEDKQKTATKVRVVINILKLPVYKDNKTFYVIPIAKGNRGYITGQDDLTEQQMVSGKANESGAILIPEPLTEAQQKKYPVVIDPTNNYRVKHLQWLNPEDPYDAVILKLLSLCGQGHKWAATKLEFDKDPQIYDGYLEDPIKETVIKNDIKKERYDAETLIRQASIDDYKRVALVLSFNCPNIYIDVKSSHDVVLGQLLDACETNPKDIKMCFSKYNPGIDRDIFILECIDANIIVRKNDNDLYHESDYIGKTIDDVKMYTSKSANQKIIAKWQSLLDQHNGVTTEPYKPDAKSDMEIILSCKAALYDGDIYRAEKILSQINKAANESEYDLLFKEITKKKEASEKVKDEEKVAKFKGELEKCTAEQLYKKISFHLSEYKKEDCAEFLTDKDKLIEYMLSVKFKKQ